jgi:molybdopterin converting factor small subunit
MGWIALATALIAGLTALITYILGTPRKIKLLKARQYELEQKLRTALAKNDTVAISSITIALECVRAQLADFNAK